MACNSVSPAALVCSDFMVYTDFQIYGSSIRVHDFVWCICIITTIRFNCFSTWKSKRQRLDSGQLPSRFTRIHARSALGTYFVFCARFAIFERAELLNGLASCSASKPNHQRIVNCDIPYPLLALFLKSYVPFLNDISDQISL